MLKIEPIRSYKLPRYPRDFYYEHLDAHPWKIAGGLVSVAGLALLVSSCKQVGVVGPPPVMPEMITEREARSVINEVFAKNGINLETDVPFSVSPGDQNPVNLELDGYNGDLHLGYEYITDEDLTTFTSEVISDLVKASEANVNGPHIKTIDTQYFSDDAEQDYDKLENMVQDFIDDLRSKGII